jgi:F-type H+-transporting ATPase subunit delta
MARGTPIGYARSLHEALEGVDNAEVSAMLEAFVKLLRRDGMLRQAEAVVEAFQAVCDREEGRVPVTFTTARPLDDDGALRLAGRVETVLGHPVRLQVGLDPALVGGAQIHVGDLLIDGSVHGRLRVLRAAAAAETGLAA